MGEIINLGGKVVDPTSLRPESAWDNEFALSRADDIVRKSAELGLAEQFLPIFGHHIADMHLVVSPRIAESRIALSGYVDPQLNGRKNIWTRQAQISLSQLSSYQNVLLKAIDGKSADSSLAMPVAPVVGITGNVIDEGDGAAAQAKELALEWLFYELSADALACSYYMQRTYGKYLKDFDGMSESTRAWLSMSRDSLRRVNVKRTRSVIELREDHLAFRAGMGLVLLSDELIRREVVTTSEDANNVMARIASRYPGKFGQEAYEKFNGQNSRSITPKNIDEIKACLESLVPRQNDDTKNELSAAIIRFTNT